MRRGIVVPLATTIAALMLALIWGCSVEHALDTPFSAERWKRFETPSCRLSMLTSVTNELRSRSFTRDEVRAYLGANYIPPEQLQPSNMAGVYYGKFLKQHDVVYFVGRRDLANAEREWTYLCLDFATNGVCTNVVVEWAGV